MRRVVLTRVGEVEALGIAVVQLNGAELPRTTDGTEDVEVDLRAVERTVACLDFVLAAGRLERGTQRALRVVPHLVRVDSNFGTCGELELRRQPERFVVPEDELREERDFVLDLIFAQEDVAVVLLELTYAGQAGERARELVAMQHV